LIANKELQVIIQHNLPRSTVAIDGGDSISNSYNYITTTQIAHDQLGKVCRNLFTLFYYLFSSTVAAR